MLVGVKLLDNLNISATGMVGRTFVKIDRWFPSSKRCGHCGYIVDKLPLNVRK